MNVLWRKQMWLEVISFLSRVKLKVCYLEKYLALGEFITGPMVKLS